MQRTLISVAWTNGRWQVAESGPRNSVSCFGERRDAMDYASGLAERTRGSTLLVHKRQLAVCGNRRAMRSALALNCNPAGAPDRAPRRRPSLRS